jgi:hypothetical protein
MNPDLELIAKLQEELKKKDLQISELELQREAWRPALQAAIHLIGKNISRPEVYKESDTRKYELALALSKAGDEARERLLKEKETDRLLNAVIDLVPHTVGAHTEGFRCDECEDLKKLGINRGNPFEKKASGKRNDVCECGVERSRHDRYIASGCREFKEKR